MLLICDRTRSERAASLRETFFRLGLPCAASAVQEIGNQLPLSCIVTWYECFDDIRRGPFDHVFVCVIGNGFVNSALNAVRVADEAEAVSYVLARMEAGAAVYPFGVIPRGDVFFAEKFFEVYGNRVEPTGAEYMIYKLLYAFPDVRFPSEKLCRFCLADSNSRRDAENTAAALISTLNRKAQNALGKPLIRSERNRGYYLNPL